MQKQPWLQRVNATACPFGVESTDIKKPFHSLLYPQNRTGQLHAEWLASRLAAFRFVKAQPPEPQAGLLPLQVAGKLDVWKGQLFPIQSRRWARPWLTCKVDFTERSSACAYLWGCKCQALNHHVPVGLPPPLPQICLPTTAEGFKLPHLLILTSLESTGNKLPCLDSVFPNGQMFQFWKSHDRNSFFFLQTSGSIAAPT